MNFKPSIMRCLLSIVLVIVLFLADSSPAYARHRAGGSSGGGGNGTSCAQDPTCDPLLLQDGGTLNKKTLIIQDMDSANPNLFTDVEGASDNPADIVELVNNAIDVWESAFEDSTIPVFNVTVGWADFGIGEQTHTQNLLMGGLVGGMKTVEQTDSAQDGLAEDGLAQSDPAELIKLRQSPATDFPSIDDEVLALHICGAPGKPDASVCSEADRTEATILFNSGQMSVHRIDETTGQIQDVPVKLLLESDPFNSAVFGPIEAIASSSPRAQQSSALIAELPNAYVVDLFTVAMHEVGHALGYSRVNQQATGFPISNHIGKGDMPDLLSPYAPFSTRKCPSLTDVTELAAVGSYVPNAQPYQLVSDNPCSVVKVDVREREPQQIGSDSRRAKRTSFGQIWQSIVEGIPILSAGSL
ncbi:MAG: hypothetical protein AAF716_11935 [Cyanobacteria bacterium P01_D01_bin.1]